VYCNHTNQDVPSPRDGVMVVLRVGVRLRVRDRLHLG